MAGREETLFQILSRQPWWLSVLIAAVLFGGTQFIYAPIAPFIALPFLGLAVWIAVTQARRGSPADAAETLAALRDMSWDAFSEVITGAYRRAGYRVEPAGSGGHDFVLSKDGRVTLLECRHWKVRSVGAATVRELADAIRRDDAFSGVCLTTGEFSGAAHDAARSMPVRLINEIELTQLVGRLPKSSGRADKK